MKTLLSENAKEYLMDLTCWAMSLAERLHTDSLRITWIDELRWFLESQLSRVFAWLHEGSDAEIRAVYQAEIPPEHMNARQLRELELYDWETIESYCCHCPWTGALADAEGEEFACPQCGESGLWIEAFEPAGPMPLLLTETRAA